MGRIVVVIVVILVEIVWVVISGRIAKAKGRSVAEGVTLGIFLGLIGLTIEACLPNRKHQAAMLARQEKYLRPLNLNGAAARCTTARPGACWTTSDGIWTATGEATGFNLTCPNYEKASGGLMPKGSACAKDLRILSPSAPQHWLRPPPPVIGWKFDRPVADDIWRSRPICRMIRTGPAIRSQGGKMLKHVRMILAAASVVALAGAGGVSAATAATTSTTAGPTVCKGVLAPGTYPGLVVNGGVANACLIQKGPVTVAGNVTVKAGGIFDSVFKAVLTVYGNISAGQGALVGLGCSPEVGCKSLIPDHFHGNVTANRPLDLIIQSGTINGNVSMTGGGGGRNCKNNPLLKSPNFSTIEDTVVYGNVSFVGLRTCWLGIIRVHLHGNLTIRGNRFADHDADEIVTNVIYGNVTCRNNVPAPQRGDSHGTKNVVHGSARRCPTLPR